MSVCKQCAIREFSIPPVLQSVVYTKRRFYSLKFTHTTVTQFVLYCFVLYCIQVFIQRPATAIGKQRRFWFD